MPIPNPLKAPNLTLDLNAEMSLEEYAASSKSSPFRLFTVFIALRVYSALPPALA
jgi:hypothetical protein